MTILSLKPCESHFRYTIYFKTSIFWTSFKLNEGRRDPEDSTIYFFINLLQMPFFISLKISTGKTDSEFFIYVRKISPAKKVLNVTRVWIFGSVPVGSDKKGETII